MKNQKGLGKIEFYIIVAIILFLAITKFGGELSTGGDIMAKLGKLAFFAQPVEKELSHVQGKWERKGSEDWIEITPDGIVKANFVFVLFEKDEILPSGFSPITEIEGKQVTQFGIYGEGHYNFSVNINNTDFKVASDEVSTTPLYVRRELKSQSDNHVAYVLKTYAKQEIKARTRYKSSNVIEAYVTGSSTNSKEDIVLFTLTVGNGYIEVTPVHLQSLQSGSFTKWP